MNNFIPLDIKKDKFFDSYLKILTPIINRICHKLSGEVCYLREKELRVIGELMYAYATSTMATPLEKNRYIFSDKVSNYIMEKYNITIYNYNNLLWRLRTVGVIQGKRNSRTLHPVFYMEIPDDYYELTIRFNFK